MNFHASLLSSRSRRARFLTSGLLTACLVLPLAAQAQNQNQELSEESQIDGPPADFPPVAVPPVQPLPVAPRPNGPVPPVPEEGASVTLPEITPYRPPAPTQEPTTEVFPQREVPAGPQAPQRVTPRPSAGEEQDLQEFLSGQLTPLSVPLSKAGAGWRTLRVPGAGNAQAAQTAPDPDEFMQMLSQSFGNDPQVVFTQGRTLRLNNVLHLIVYRAQFPTRRETEAWLEARLPAGTPSPSISQVRAVTRAFLDTIPLRASLLRADDLSGLREISPFDFTERFGQFWNRVEAQHNQQMKPNPGNAQAAAPARPSASSATRAPAAATRATTAPATTAPATPQAIRSEQAARTRLGQLHTALLQYRQDWDGVLPPLDNAATAQKMLAPYLRSSTAWTDPASQKPFLPNARLSKKPWSHLAPFASGLIAFYSSAPTGGRRWVLRLDGVVRSVTDAEWRKLRTAARLP
jgi:hypothetical protein